MRWQPGASSTSLVISVLGLQGQLAYIALLPVSGAGLVHATTTCLAQLQSMSQDTNIGCVHARIQTLAAELAQYAMTPATHPVDLIQGLPAGGLAHLVTKLQIVQTPHILLKV